MAQEQTTITDDKLTSKINEWITWNKNEKMKSEVDKLLAQNNKTELEKLFLHRMEFGTAGLRGRMGPGYSQMNDLVIIQTAQGLLKYLSTKQVEVLKNGLVIGYDGRHNSKRFAELTAGIFLRAGSPVYLYSKVCPTPFVPFGVTKYQAAVGVMVTASHNPKEDNGYKVYWNNGAQIISPHDKGITKCIEENLKPEEGVWDLSILNDNKKLIDPLEEVMKDYLGIIGRNVVDKGKNLDAPFNITYTAMHGVGYPCIVEAFKKAGFKELIAVKEQILPDPEFPTVKFPNPEEGKSALDLAIKTADSNNSVIILANDPDADRLAVAEKTENWKVFTGNEIGAFLGWWMIHTYKNKHPSADYSNVYLLSSTVSSKILKTMATAEGFSFEETLTGFKWMGNRAYQLMKEGKEVLFAFEEAIGFMCGHAVLDKDGVSAAVAVAELTTYLYNNGLTLTAKLIDIYNKYGHHLCDNSYFICHKPEVIKVIFNRLRNFKEKCNGLSLQSYPECLVNGKYKVISVRDLTTGFDSSKQDNKTSLPISSSSEMITFTFDNGFVVTLRTSGTEPKLKYYTELCANPEIQDSDKLQSTLKEMVNGVVEEFLEPEKNGLLYRTS
uniref:Putative phosphoglucomutase/phosphomannomutase n=1 Tax=Triatoma dimidiata TaxID=72491 RepID=A0A0V0G6E7_TRIDM